MAEEFKKPINHSTEAPTPIGSVLVDGESHDVWKAEDVPLPGMRYLMELQSRQEDLLALGSNPNAVLDDPAFLCLVARAYAPTLKAKPLEKMSGAGLLGLVNEINRLLVPFVDDQAVEALRRLAESRKSTSTSTPSGRTSRSRTGGARKRSTGSRSTKRSRTSK